MVSNTDPISGPCANIPAWERDYDNLASARQVVVGLALDGGDTHWLGRIDFYLYEQQMASRPWADVPLAREMPRGYFGVNVEGVSRF